VKTKPFYGLFFFIITSDLTLPVNLVSKIKQVTYSYVKAKIVNLMTNRSNNLCGVKAISLRRNYIFLKNKNVGILRTVLLFALSTVLEYSNFCSKTCRF
jgi:hypothetical protein